MALLEEINIGTRKEIMEELFIYIYKQEFLKIIIKKYISPIAILMPSCQKYRRKLQNLYFQIFLIAKSS
jgi:hypothetical protein